MIAEIIVTSTAADRQTGDSRGIVFEQVITGIATGGDGAQ